MDRAKRILLAALAAVRLVPRKVIYVGASVALAWASARVPALQVVTPDFVTDAMLALLAAHTVTDVAAIIAATVGEVVAGSHRKPSR